MSNKLSRSGTQSGSQQIPVADELVTTTDDHVEEKSSSEIVEKKFVTILQVSVSLGNYN